MVKLYSVRLDISVVVDMTSTAETEYEAILSALEHWHDCNGASVTTEDVTSSVATEIIDLQ